MASIISASTTSSTALNLSGDTTGILQLATGATPTTAVTIDASQNVTFAKAINKSALPTGSVLQVVNATYSTQVSNSTSTYADTGLTATITPTSATSKILVIVNQNGVGKFSNDTAVNMQLLKGVTVLAYFSGYVGQNATTSPNVIGSVSIGYLDSPATTSATTYKTQFNSVSNNASATVQQLSAVSTITLMEIAA